MASKAWRRSYLVLANKDTGPVECSPGCRSGGDVGLVGSGVETAGSVGVIGGLDLHVAVHSPADSPGVLDDEVIAGLSVTVSVDAVSDDDDSVVDAAVVVSVTGGVGHDSALVGEEGVADVDSDGGGAVCEGLDQLLFLVGGA